jgi:ribonucleoside-triphosphate reductase
VKGTPTEVYSRIVGYYRSVRNWNKGKREEYGQRVMFQPDASLLASCTPVAEYDTTTCVAPAYAVPVPTGYESAGEPSVPKTEQKRAFVDERILLFIRPACPACPSAQAAVGRLGIPLELYDADTDEGLAEAVRHQVLSTPTAILLSSTGKELGRARDPQSIERLLEVV